jgi:hypothetical protein
LKSEGIIAGIGLLGAGLYNYGSGMNKDNTKNLVTGVSRVGMNMAGIGSKESTGTALMRTA